MTKPESFNPCEHRRGLIASEVSSDPNPWTVTTNGICCRRSVNLPEICLQTGETDDLQPHVINVRASSKPAAQARRIGIAVMIASGCLPIFLLDPDILPAMPDEMVIPGMIGGILAGMAITVGALLLTPRIVIQGFITQKTSRSLLRCSFLYLFTRLPLVVFLGAVFLGRFNELLTPRTSMAVVGTALCAHTLLPRVLFYHWKSTRERGLALKATQRDDGTFEVTGFSTEFLSALNRPV